jgi:hypothetical protein
MIRSYLNIKFYTKFKYSTFLKADQDIKKVKIELKKLNIALILDNIHNFGPLIGIFHSFLIFSFL